MKKYIFKSEGEKIIMQRINNELLACKECPFQEFEFNNSKELGFGSFGRIMFVGQSPAITSNKSQWASKFDEFFSEILEKVDIEEEDYYFTNLIKTAIPKHRLPTKDEITHCRSHLYKEIALVRPQILVLLGKPVRDAFNIKWPDSFSKVRLPGASEFIRTYAIAHPGYLHYSPEKEGEYLKKLNKIHKFYHRTLF